MRRIASQEQLSPREECPSMLSAHPAGKQERGCGSSTSPRYAQVYMMGLKGSPFDLADQTLL